MQVLYSSNFNNEILSSFYKKNCISSNCKSNCISLIFHRFKFTKIYNQNIDVPLNTLVAGEKLIMSKIFFFFLL